MVPELVPAPELASVIVCFPVAVPELSLVLEYTPEHDPASVSESSSTSSFPKLWLDLHHTTRQPSPQTTCSQVYPRRSQASQQRDH